MKKVSTVGIIVTYQPNQRDLENSIRVVIDQVDHLIIIDNASSGIGEFFDKLLTIYKNITITKLTENLGVAYAQNIGLLYALKQNAEFALILDQDSLPEPLMVQKLINAYQNSTLNDSLVALGPSYVDPRSNIQSFFMVSRYGFPFRYKPYKKNQPKKSLKVAFLISSGTLIVLSKLKNIGGMRSDYFIDHVDTEWCLRARSFNFALEGLHSAKMYHTLGDQIRKFWFVYMRNIATHSPIRDYYMFRNTILLIRDTPVPFFWSIFLLFRLIQFFVYFLIFENYRKERLKLIALGLFHGIFNIRGKLDLETKKCESIPKTLLDPQER